MKFFTKASAIEKESVLINGEATEYFVKRSCIVSIYELLFRVIGKGPIISIETLSKAAPEVSVINLGCLTLTLVNFFI